MNESGKCDTVVVNGVTYVREQRSSGTRAVVVVDRGWIFAGDVTEANGKIVLSRAVHVLRWEVGGFAGLVSDPKAARANIKRMTADVRIPADAEIFRCLVGDDWGL